MAKQAKLLCDNFRCGWVGTEPLTAPDPFNEGETLIACPKCRDQSLVKACETDGCKKQASSGSKHADGVYRFTCHQHNPIVLSRDED